MAIMMKWYRYRAQCPSTVPTVDRVGLGSGELDKAQDVGSISMQLVCILPLGRKSV
jgi:hypothetical protein